MASEGISREIVAIINPNWLKVDRAMIFLRSDSTIAAVLAINIVVVASIRRAAFNCGVARIDG